MWVPFDKATGKARGDYQDFVTGFVTPEENLWGRRLGAPLRKMPACYLAKMETTIWRVSYEKK